MCFIKTLGKSIRELLSDSKQRISREAIDTTCICERMCVNGECFIEDQILNEHQCQSFYCNSTNVNAGRNGHWHLDYRWPGGDIPVV